MTITKQIIYSLPELETAAAALVNETRNASIITFTGPLGAGKTTLVQAFLRALGVTDSITSPTYTYVNIYQNKQGRTFYHFDLYRINSIDDFIESGFNEYLYAPNSLALIEWPDIIAPLLMDNAFHVSIDYCQEQDKRILCIKKG
jgi:tRNA threonylcarbamoyladenosine biosynthesis protein TsaE